MGFKKGHSGNPTGRKKGTPNKTTKEIREVIHGVISSGFSKTKVLKDLNELSPKQRLDYMLRLMEYVLSKPKSVEEISETDTMSEKYSRITAYINSAFNVSGENRKNNADKKSDRGSLVHIIPEGRQNNDCET
jgi:hypothetical protein